MILNVCKDNIVDLLILGALKKESVIEHYVGSIAEIFLAMLSVLFY